jgi:hypothetical protein
VRSCQLLAAPGAVLVAVMVLLVVAVGGAAVLLPLLLLLREPGALGSVARQGVALVPPGGCTGGASDLMLWLI